MSGLSSRPALASPPFAPTPAVPPLGTPEGLASLLELIAALFARAPEDATVASLRRGAGARRLADSAGEAAFAGPIAAVRAVLDDEEDDAALARRLGVVFGLLFLGIAGPATVAPYESVHRCGGRMFQAPVGEMDRLLAAHDLSVGFDREPSDHLAIETALLARLVAAGHPDRLALARRLAGWTPMFRAGLDDADGTGFYAAVAELLAAAIAATVEISEPHDDSRTA